MSISGSLDVPDARLLQPDVQAFIRAHVSSDVHELSLRQPPQIYGVPFRDIAEQIAGLQKARQKLPRYFATQGILYPPLTNLEQSSSEKTAEFKAEQAAAFSFPHHAQCVDLTGGFGVDACFLSRRYAELHYVEPDGRLLRLARHNHQRLGAFNITYHEADALNFLRETALLFDLVYLDPSRRKANDQRRIELTGYSPDIRSLIPLLEKRTKRVMLKASPMLDIGRGLQVLSNTSKVCVVAVGNELRELLFFWRPDQTDEPMLEAIDLSDDRPPFSFYRHEERAAAIRYADPSRYIFEPGAALLKAGAFRLVAARFGVAKLHPNTHMYTAERPVDGFPGRTYESLMLARRFRPDLETFFPDGMANVVVRNYPLTASQLRTSVGLREGGDTYLLAFTSQSGPMLAAAKRLR